MLKTPLSIIGGLCSLLPLVSAQQEAGVALIGLFGLLYIMFFGVIMLLAIASFVVWIIMLVDCAKRKFKEPNDKTVWILVIVLAGIIGAIVYYFVIKRKD